MTIAPNAIYVHCFAHCNQLIVKDSIKNSNLMSSSLDLCQSLYAIIGAYPKRILLFEKIQNDFNFEPKTEDYKVLRLLMQSLSVFKTDLMKKSSHLPKTIKDVLLKSMKERNISIVDLKNVLLNKDLLRTQLVDSPPFLASTMLIEKRKSPL